MGTPLATSSRVVDPSTVGLIVVDMTNDYLTTEGAFYCPAAPRTVEPLNRVISVLREAGSLIVFSRHVLRSDGADLGIADQVAARRWSGYLNSRNEPQYCTQDAFGSQIFAGLDVRESDIVIDKNRHSAFANSILESVLRRRGIETVAVAGVAIEGCCDATIKDALARHFGIILLSDCAAAYDYEDAGWGPWASDDVHAFVCTHTKAAFGDVLTSSELMQRVGSTPS